MKTETKPQKLTLDLVVLDVTGEDVPHISLYDDQDNVLLNEPFRDWIERECEDWTPSDLLAMRDELTRASVNLRARHNTLLRERIQ